MFSSEVTKLLIIRTIGNFLLLLSLFGLVFTFGDAVRQEVLYRFNLIRGVHYVVASDVRVPVSQFSVNKEKTETLSAKDTDFSILIPKIGASAKVIANVDPGNYDEYTQALKNGVAHAAGTVFPGMQGNIYLFAHSTDNFWNVSRYNAVFYLVKELEKGDSVVLIYGGKRYDYEVSEKKIVEANDVAYLSRNASKGEMLTLQTCWPPGTSWKRLLVFAKPKSVNTQ